MDDTRLKLQKLKFVFDILSVMKCSGTLMTKKTKKNTIEKVKNDVELTPEQINFINEVYDSKNDIIDKVLTSCKDLAEQLNQPVVDFKMYSDRRSTRKATISKNLGYFEFVSNYWKENKLKIEERQKSENLNHAQIFPVINRELGQQWKSFSDEEKQKYHVMAKQRL